MRICGLVGDFSESQEVAHSAPKKRKIPVGIVLPNQVSFNGIVPTGDVCGFH